MNRETWIALDGGTTNTRGSLVIDGKVTDTVKIDVGVRDTCGKGDNAVKSAVRTCLDSLFEKIGSAPGTIACVASGMLGSEAGLVALPHVFAPASADDIAHGSILWSDPLNDRVTIRILPGVRTGPDSRHHGFAGLLAQDLMRGEETQVWGIRESYVSRGHELSSRPWLLLWPGSHTKLIAVEADGTITGSYTTLAGESYAALKKATLLKRSVPEMPTREIDDELLNEAMDAVRKFGLLRAAFWTRVADIAESLDNENRGQWLSAIVTAEDVRGLEQHPWLQDSRFAAVLIGGETSRQATYEKLLRRILGERVDSLASAVVQDAAALGAVSLAQRAQARSMGK